MSSTTRHGKKHTEAIIRRRHSKRKNTMRNSNARPSARSKPYLKPYTMWACLMTSSSKSKGDCDPKKAAR